MGQLGNELLPQDVAQLTDPARLLDFAWACEPSLLLNERFAALDRLEQLLETRGATLPAPAGRDWALELRAERAIDAVSNLRPKEALDLSEGVLAQADPAHGIAIARASLARARVWAWEGTEETRRRADALLAEAGELFRELGHSDWYGYTVYWRGYSVYFQAGHVRRAAELMEKSLTILARDSPRRGTVLTFYADALIDLSRLEDAEAALSEAERLAEQGANQMQRGYATWARAHIAAARLDAYATERLLREVERDANDWFDTHIGVAFLTDAAMLLNMLGLDTQAEAYLDKAMTRSPADENVRQARAMLLARTGDPWEGLEALQALVRGDWLDKRWIWRHSLLSAWSTFRAGREGAGELAARAFTQAQESAGVITTLVHEPDLARMLAPLAERAGSRLAGRIMLGSDLREPPSEPAGGAPRLLVRLFGEPSVTTIEGGAIELPPGMPGELVRMLALYPLGLPTDVVLEHFFPDAPADAARQRLRQVLSRLRSSTSEELVLRSGEQLLLAPAWVDVREFLTAADRVRAASGPRAVHRAYGALALWREPLLPADPYAAWAEGVRAEVEYRHLALLDLVAADAIRRRSHQEALTALEAAMRADPDDTSRPAQAAQQLRELGRETSAESLAARSSPPPG
jgi:tetratricopeptide (TPR) repeat protein/DNA-binding SARP family transcriptional activator